KENGYYVDQDFLDIFSFPTIYGDASTALTEPNSIVISREVSEKLFGTVDPVGESIKLDSGEKPYTIKAVVENVPNNSDIQFDWLAPWENFTEDRDWVKTWGNVIFPTYVQLVKDSDIAQVNEKIAYLGNGKEMSQDYFLQAFSEKYLYGNYEDGKQAGGRIEYVRLFSAVAIFLLIIACINFMNLATARAGRRAKEIGIRKVSGANQKALIGQFMGEVFILSSVALLLALALSHFFLQSFNQLLNQDMVMDYKDPGFWLTAFAILGTTSLLAGSYPAFLLSSLKPAKVLKGEILRTGDQSTFLRKGLVVLQFTISAFLIVSTLVIQGQIFFIKNKNLGIDRQDLIFAVMEGELEYKSDVYRKELLKSSAIQSVSFSQSNLLNLSGSSNDLSWPGKQEDESLLVSAAGIDAGIMDALGLPLIAGRDFSPDMASDTSNYIVNERLVKALGLENPIGAEISFWNGPGQIIGVVADYHMKSLHQEIAPMVWIYDPQQGYFSWVKPAEGQTEAALAHMEKVSKALNPVYPFEYEFADQEFARQYQSETLIGKLANLFGAVAILISCLGLLGLAAYSAERRRKEIGIRKVLGASIQSIIQLLSKEFVYLILIALTVALPLGWIAMDSWLNNFAYRINIEWWYFLLAITMAFGVAALPVGFQGLRAALSNPVDSIRNE
ncbi:MAG: FtsX-like permease family protein, partial [Bacteroidota bacterium]